MLRRHSYLAGAAVAGRSRAFQRDDDDQRLERRQRGQGCGRDCHHVTTAAATTDQVRGSNLADTMFGGDGNDKISAAGGGDTLTGGGGQ